MTGTARPTPAHRGDTRSRTLLVATTNTGKLREITDILAGLSISLLTLRDRPGIPEPDEIGHTLGENARLKALYYAGETNLTSVADDSGLEIEALDNAPGVHSARWHGTNYPFKFRKIQELLHERGVDGSAARFVCHVALAKEGKIVFEAEGTVRGEIIADPRGTKGFGYDPIFFYPPLGRTLAELALAEKSAVSHRGKAFAALREHLVAHPGLIS
jgi:XTP/dITP diphosphohydrolase